MDDNGIIEIRDFTLPAAKMKPKRFRIDDDVFEAPAVIPLGLYADLAQVGDVTKITDAVVGIEKIRNVFELLLVPTAFERFSARFTDRVNPIGFEHVLPIVTWLLEQYGLRPTQPPAPSSGGSESADGSTSLTAGAPATPFPGPSSVPAAS